MIGEEKLVQMVGAGNVNRELATLKEYSRDMSFVIRPQQCYESRQIVLLTPGKGGNYLSDNPRRERNGAGRL